MFFYEAQQYNLIEMQNFNLSPPTDNLYKFMAIFGLILFLFSVSLMFLQLNTFYGKYIELQSKKAASKAEVRFAHYLLESAQETTNSEYKKFNLLPETIKNNNDIHTLSFDNQLKILGIESIMQAMLDSAEYGSQIFLQNYLKKREILVDSAKLDVLANQTRFLIKIYTIPLLISSVIMIFDFVLWYKKLQIYQDINLRKDLDI